MMCDRLTTKLIEARAIGMALKRQSEGLSYPDGSCLLPDWFLESNHVMLAPQSQLDRVEEQRQGDPFTLLAITIVDPISEYAVEYGLLGFCRDQKSYFSCFVTLSYLIEGHCHETCQRFLRVSLREHNATYYCTKPTATLESALSDLCTVLSNPERAFLDCGISYPPIARHSNLQNALTAAAQFFQSSGV